MLSTAVTYFRIIHPRPVTRLVWGLSAARQVRGQPEQEAGGGQAEPAGEASNRRGRESEHRRPSVAIFDVEQSRVRTWVRLVGGMTASPSSRTSARSGY
jgi:hypothetical protein